MAYPKHARWTIYGDYDSPPPEFADEIWNFGFHSVTSVVGDAGGWPDATPQALADVVGPKIKTIWQGAGNPVPKKVRFMGLKVAFIDTDGKYAQDAGLYESPVVSGGPDTQFLAQGSVVVSLVSDKFRPPAKYGRCYTPGHRLPGTANMVLSSTTRDTYISFVASILDAIAEGDEVDGPSIPALVSSQGHARAIKELWCGSVIDTQRRRRNRANETYTKTPYAP